MPLGQAFTDIWCFINNFIIIIAKPTQILPAKALVFIPGKAPSSWELPVILIVIYQEVDVDNIAQDVYMLKGHSQVWVDCVCTTYIYISSPRVD